MSKLTKEEEQEFDKWWKEIAEGGEFIGELVVYKWKGRELWLESRRLREQVKEFEKQYKTLQDEVLSFERKISSFREKLERAYEAIRTSIPTKLSEHGVYCHWCRVSVEYNFEEHRWTGEHNSDCIVLEAQQYQKEKT